MKAKKNLTLILITLAMFCTFILSGCSSASASAGSSAQAGNGAQASNDAQAGNGTQVGNGAGTTASETEADLLSRIQESGEIVVAMEGTWAPWTYHDEKDELVGYDVEVAQLIAEKLGVEVKFIEGEWDGLLAGLDDSRYDIMVNGVGITEERQEKYDFSTPYAYNRTAVIVRDDYNEINSMEDLNGKKTANTISSTYAMQAERYGAEVSGVDDLNQTIELLLSGRIDATLNAEVTFFDYVNAHPEAGIRIAAYSDEVERVAIPVRKGDDSASLLATINDALAELSESGQLSELSEKYFGTDISQES
ncbi:MAG: transporter substrate-binding domain-containing protein [Clostridiales bacterium]|nr:transporter substrate-binding domain-containing protein [Clostridiales bacterium]